MRERESEMRARAGAMRQGGRRMRARAFTSEAMGACSRPRARVCHGTTIYHVPERLRCMETDALPVHPDPLTGCPGVNWYRVCTCV